jgi:hypothetical protein
VNKLFIFAFALVVSSAQAQLNPSPLKTINNLLDTQISAFREYFKEVRRVRMQVNKPDHNYWFNFGTSYTGEPYYRILITRERKENKLKETIEYFSETLFSARLDFIREGADLQETEDEFLIKGEFPLPKNEDRWILASSILGFEFAVEKKDNYRKANFYYSLNSIRYSIEELIEEEKRTYSYAAAVFQDNVDIQPQIQIVKVDGEWEPRYFIFPRQDQVTPKTYVSTFEGLFGVPLQFKCFFAARYLGLGWPFEKLPSCLGVSIHYSQQ